MLRRLFPIFACTLAMITAITPARAAAAERWILASDIHFNPFSNPKVVGRLAAAPWERWRGIFAEGREPETFSDYGSDTNFPLLESAIDAMKTEVGQPAAIVISGDFLAHGFRARFEQELPHRTDADYDAFVDKTIAFIAGEFGSAFPHTRVLPVIGNNDGYCGDYATTPGDPFLAHMAAAWAPLVADPSPVNGFVAQFSRAGYYAEDLLPEHLQVIVLNDVLWSPNYKNACGDPKSDPAGDEMTWLTATLKAVPASEHVWIVGHIPPGVDVYSTLHAKAAGTVTMMLSDPYSSSLLNLLEDPGNRVSFAVAGHTHMNAYRLIGSPNATYSIPMTLVPAVSPVFNNNPSFVVAEVDRSSGTLLNLTTFVLPDLAVLAKDARHAPTVWRREFSFDQAYGTQAVDSAGLAALQAVLLTNDSVRRRFDRYYDGESGRAPITESTWHAYWCGNVAMTAPAYLACAMPQIETQQLPPQPSAPPLPAPAPTAAPSSAPSTRPAPAASP